MKNLMNVTVFFTMIALIVSCDIVPGNDGLIEASKITHNSVDLKWVKATIKKKSSDKLEYLVSKSLKDNISTPELVLQNGELVQDWTAVIDMVKVNNLKSDTLYYFNVLVRNSKKEIAAYQMVAAKTLIEEIPDVLLPGNNGLTEASKITHNSVDLKWEKATSKNFTQDQIEYLVVKSLSNNIGTPELILKNGELVQDWTKDIDAISVNKLISGVAYYFNILVKNPKNDKVAYKTVVVNTLLEETPDVITPGNNGLIEANNIAEEFVDLKWVKATSKHYYHGILEYLVVKSLSDNIATPEQILQNGESVQTWTRNIETVGATNLKPDTQYYFNVLVRNPKNEMAAYNTFTVKTLPIEISEEFDWVIMYYVDADNDLEQFLMFDLNEIEGVDISKKKVLVVALVDRVGGYWTGDGDWRDTRAFKIGFDKDGFNENLSQSSKRISIPSLGITQTSNNVELNMGDPDTLEKFVSFVLEKYKSKHYQLLFTNHGAGWGIKKELLYSPQNKLMQQIQDRERLINMANHKYLCVDQTSNGDALTVKEVRTALEKSLGNKRKLDILSMDACLMGSLEVAYELKDLADTFVASSEVVPGFGFPYTQIMNKIAQSDQIITADFFAKTMVEEYYDVYTNGGCVEDPNYCIQSMITLSAINMSKIENVKKSVDSLGLELKDKITNIDTRLNSLQFYLPFNMDITDFTYKESLAEAARIAVQDSMKEAIIYHKSDYIDSYGLSIYFPLHKNGVSSGYNADALLFVKESHGWNDFIHSLIPTFATDQLEICTTPGVQTYGNNDFNEAYNNTSCNYLKNNLPVDSYFYYQGDQDWFYIPDPSGKFQISVTAPTGVDVYLLAISADQSDGVIFPSLPVGTGGMDYGVGEDEQVVVDEPNDSQFGYFVLVGAYGHNRVEPYRITYSRK